jgi:cell division protein ZapA
MSALNQRTTVEIDSETYTIKSDIPPHEVQRLADYVNLKIQEIKSKAKEMPSIRIAVLACLNIAEELFTVRRQFEVTKNLMEVETTKILELLDESSYSSTHKQDVL